MLTAALVTPAVAAAVRLCPVALTPPFDAVWQPDTLLRWHCQAGAATQPESLRLLPQSALGLHVLPRAPPGRHKRRGLTLGLCHNTLGPADTHLQEGQHRQQIHRSIVHAGSQAGRLTRLSVS